MALIPNDFSTYSMTPEEDEAGQVLNQLQKQVLCNKLSETAYLILNITADPVNPAAYFQRLAYLQGQRDVIKWLLDSSTSIEQAVIQRSEERPE